MGEGRTCAENDRHCGRSGAKWTARMALRFSVSLRDFSARGAMSYNMARGVVCGVVKFTESA